MSLSVNGATGRVYTDIEKKFQYQQLGIPDDVISQGESAIEDYAYENSITLPNFDTQDQEALFEPAEEDASQAQAAQANNAQVNYKA